MGLGKKMLSTHSHTIAYEKTGFSDKDLILKLNAYHVIHNTLCFQMRIQTPELYSFTWSGTVNHARLWQ